MELQLQALQLGSEEEGDSTIRRIQTEKFLVLNLIATLREQGLISGEQEEHCKGHALTCSEFDASTILSYAPPRWLREEESPGKKPGTSPTLQSCFRLIEGTGKLTKLPWHTVQTAVILMQRYCYVCGAQELPLGERCSGFVASLQFPDRVVLSATCLLVASKAEETLCRLSALLKSLRQTIGQAAFLMAIPASTTRSGGGRRQPRDPDDAMAAAVRSMESKVLDALGFDIEAQHPQVYVSILHLLLYPSHADGECVDDARAKTFELMEFSHQMSIPVTILFPVICQAIACVYLGWYATIGRRGSCSFPWDRIQLSHEQKVSVKGVIGYIEAELLGDAKKAISQWAQKLFDGVSELPELSGITEYKKGQVSSVRMYQRQEKICEGTYGTVWVAHHRHTKEQVAVKLLKNTLGRDGFPYYMLREILFLRRLDHPNIVAGQEVLVDRSGSEYKFFVVMEFISFDLRDLWSAQVDRSAQPSWSEAHVKHLTMQLLEAIAYMHQQGLMHRDIKLENLLFDSGVLKVADLGSIRDAGRTELKLTTAVVTLWYRPPELLLGNTLYTSSIDIWSIGCVIVELLVMRALLPGKDVNDMMRWIVATIGKPSEAVWRTHFADLPKSSKLVAAIDSRLKPRPLEKILGKFSPNCVDLISKMVCYDPDARITAAEALKHPYFQEDPKPEPYHPKIAE